MVPFGCAAAYIRPSGDVVTQTPARANHSVGVALGVAGTCAGTTSSPVRMSRTTAVPPAGTTTAVPWFVRSAGPALGNARSSLPVVKSQTRAVPSSPVVTARAVGPDADGANHTGVAA